MHFVDYFEYVFVTDNFSDIFLLKPKNKRLLVNLFQLGEVKIQLSSTRTYVDSFWMQHKRNINSIMDDPI